jgi:hypothetical protein
MDIKAPWFLIMYHTHLNFLQLTIPFFHCNSFVYSINTTPDLTTRNQLKIKSKFPYVETWQRLATEITTILFLMHVPHQRSPQIKPIKQFFGQLFDAIIRVRGRWKILLRVCHSWRVIRKIQLRTKLQIHHRKFDILSLFSTNPITTTTSIFFFWTTTTSILKMVELQYNT